MEEEKKIYVGNLEYTLTEDEVKAFFEEKGYPVADFKIIIDRVSNRSKGFGFAEFASDDVARDAIEAMNGQEIKGRRLRVNWAKRRDSFPPKQKLY